MKVIADWAAEVVAAKGSCWIIDLGGTSGFWATWSEFFDFDVVKITCVNPDPDHNARPVKGVTVLKGDGSALPLPDGVGDICFSNSVIEHVGRWPDMRRFAAECQRVAASYYVQTPYFWFPIEPHARTPFLQFLPHSLATRLVSRRKCGFYKKAANLDEAWEIIEDATMLDLKQFRYLFPDAEIRKEKAYGLIKALIAMRNRPEARVSLEVSDAAREALVEALGGATGSTAEA